MCILNNLHLGKTAAPDGKRNFSVPPPSTGEAKGDRAYTESKTSSSGEMASKHADGQSKGSRPNWLTSPIFTLFLILKVQGFFRNSCQVFLIIGHQQLLLQSQASQTGRCARFSFGTFCLCVRLTMHANLHRTITQRRSILNNSKTRRAILIVGQLDGAEHQRVTGVTETTILHGKHRQTSARHRIMAKL